MVFFHNDKRQELLSILKRYYADEQEFSELLERLQKTERNITVDELNNRIQVVDEKLISDSGKMTKEGGYELNQYDYQILSDIIREDAAIVHLTYELIRNQKLVFNDKETHKERKAIHIIIRDMIKDFENIVKFRKHMTFITKADKIAFDKQLNSLQGQLKRLKWATQKIVHRFVVMGTFSNLSGTTHVYKKKPYVIVKGDELLIQFFNQEWSEKNKEWVDPMMIVFYHNVLVAEMTLSKPFDTKEKIVSPKNSRTAIPFRGYFRRVIKMLFAQNAINKWKSFNFHSQAVNEITKNAHKMYESLMNDPDLDVKLVEKTWEKYYEITKKKKGDIIKKNGRKHPV